jgi:hypothetical protein
MELNDDISMSSNMDSFVLCHVGGMKHYYDFHHHMGITYLYTRPIEQAQRAGVSMPTMEMHEAELLLLDKRNQL